MKLKKNHNLDDDVSDEWTGEDLGSSLQLCGIQTLTDRERKKLGIVEMVLYNMASFLASFAIGFDVRISNLQPPQQRLQRSFQALEHIKHNDLRNFNLKLEPFYKYEFQMDEIELETHYGPAKQKNR